MKLVHLNSITEIGVSHNADIKKKTFINKGEIPNLMMFSTAVFTPGQEVETHKHDTMYEVFYILSGKAIFTVSGEAHELSAGNCITIEPGELHSQKNPFNTNVTWVYFGIATDK